MSPLSISWDSARALHFVLKIGNLRKSIEFFRDKLQMRVLRHEVFDQGCEAACNGPYSNKWSKTMIGYGAEDNHFVLELTYNYSVGQYKLGNDLQYIKISLRPDVFQKILSHGDMASALDKGSSTVTVNSPDGYKFLISKDDTIDRNDVTEVCLSSGDIKRSHDFWNGLLKMQSINQNRKEVDDELLLRYKQDQASLRLKKLVEPVDHKTAYGRIAFSCPSESLKSIQDLMEQNKQKVLTPFLSLDTPGKATVQVVILADPDGHEICFVGDEGFRELSKVDPKANELIEQSLAEDKSEEWFRKKGLSKAEA